MNWLDVMDQEGHLEDHVGGGAFLHELAVDRQPHGQVLVAGDLIQRKGG